VTSIASDSQPSRLSQLQTAIVLGAIVIVMLSSVLTGHAIQARRSLNAKRATPTATLATADSAGAAE
jgi:hypothetical protein